MARRRFGRNQKRKFREQVVKLEKEKQDYKNQASYLAGDVLSLKHQLESVLGRIWQVTGRSSSLLEPENIPNGNDETWRVGYYTPPSTNQSPILGIDSVRENLYIELNRLDALYEKYPDLRRAIHFRVQNKDVPYGDGKIMNSYMFSDEVINMNGGFPKYMVEDMVRECVKDIEKRLLNDSTRTTS